MGEMKGRSVKRVVFCDFDGTITEVDAFVNVCRHFAPEMVEKLLPGVMRGGVSLKEGIRRIVESVKSCRYPEMLDYVRDSQIRPGLERLLDFLEEREVPFVVISGGLKGLVERQLGALKNRVDGIYAADVSVEHEFLEVVSDFEGETELVAKVRVMAHYDFTESVAIGDGLTDFKMAFAADTVFARGDLAAYLEREKCPYTPWRDFHDVRNFLLKLWG